jgi:hypothetical protein
VVKRWKQAQATSPSVSASGSGNGHRMSLRVPDSSPQAFVYCLCRVASGALKPAALGRKDEPLDTGHGPLRQARFGDRGGDTRHRLRAVPRPVAGVASTVTASRSALVRRGLLLTYATLGYKCLRGLSQSVRAWSQGASRWLASASTA